MKLKEDNSPTKKAKTLKKNSKISKETKKKSREITANQITRYFTKNIVETVDLTTCTRDISVDLIKSSKPPVVNINPIVEQSRKENVFTAIKDEEKIFHIFPFNSHIRQANGMNAYWSSACNILKIKQHIPLENSIHQFSLNMETFEKVPTECSIKFNAPKNMKTTLNEIKRNNPNFPVNKIFKDLCRKNGKNFSNFKSIDSSLDYLMWTEKYKPTGTDDIIGQTRIVTEIKKWLETFENQKKSDSSSDSEGEFDIDDYEKTNESLLQNTIILEGPTGCGKSCVVYAVCKSLGYNILEINASSLRTGKKLMQELREATQSYQINKSEEPLFGLKKRKKSEDKKKLKACVLFIEDIDIVFDEDDGFLPSLIQLAMTTKCPIILTTTDKNSSFVQQFMNQQNCRLFNQTYPQNISVWLQILCLVEGISIETQDINMLLNYNKGDIRQCLLELQYLIESEFNDNKTEKSANESGFNLIKCKTNKLIFEGDLGVVWWNFFRIFATLNKENTISNEFSNISESLSTIGLLSTKCNSFNKIDPITKHWSTKFTDSLELKEYQHNFINSEYYNDFFQLFMSIHGSKISDNSEDILSPSAEDIRHRKNLHKSIKALEECIELTSYVDRKAIALDYLPSLRNIARSERLRYTNNVKRSNRFRHYFRELSSSYFTDDLYNSICDLMI